MMDDVLLFTGAIVKMGVAIKLSTMYWRDFKKNRRYRKM